MPKAFEPVAAGKRSAGRNHIAGILKETSQLSDTKIQQLLESLQSQDRSMRFERCAFLVFPANAGIH